jgi:tetratricopeptide (TPR) repeat protein
LHCCLALKESFPLRRIKGFSWNILGNIALYHGDYTEAEHCYQQSLAALRNGEDAGYMVCVAYQSLGRLLIIQGEAARAIPLLEEGLAIRRREHERIGSAQAAAYLALAYIQAEQQLAEAEMLLTEALQSCKMLDKREGLVLCHLSFGCLESKRRRSAAAIE